MSARWLKRDRDREDPDDVDTRIERQAQRAGRSVEDEQEAILRDVLPNVRRSVADAGLTMGQYLELNRVEYHDLLASSPGSRTLIGRRHGLIDNDSFVRLRRWIEEAAARAGEAPEIWAVRTGTSGPLRPWDRRRPAEPAPAPNRPADVSAPAAAADATGDDPLLDRLERLAALRDSGVLTEDEFQAQKRRLLDGAA
jgi:plasmid stability protein